MDVTTLLLPGQGVCLRRLTISPGIVSIHAETTSSTAECPGCHSPSDRIHGRYSRSVANLPCQGRRVLIRLIVRRFCCPNVDCPRRTFSERLLWASPYAQATKCLAATHRAIGFSQGGEAGARLARLMGTPASADTLLRRIRQAGHPVFTSHRALGVDDFALRMGQMYGTVLVDLARHRVIDLLPDREASTLASWLRGHEGVEIVSRDRASAYSQAAREAVPEAMQVADRWHLICNLRDVLERILQQRSSAVRERLKQGCEATPAPIRPSVSGSDAPASPGSERHGARRIRFDEVRRLHDAGHSIRGIAASLGLHYRTVERYVRSDACPDWRPGHRRPSRLDRFAEDIGNRLRDGCRNVNQILRDLRAIGYRGGRTALRDYVRRPEADSGIPARPTPSFPPRVDVPSSRRLAVSVVRRPDSRSASETRCLDALKGMDGEVGEAVDLAEKFAALIRGRHSDQLTAWLIRSEASSVAGIRTFASRLRRDEEAVRAGATVEWSNGQVEGSVNRLKVIKRSMYGRARFDLRKARVLHAI